AARCIELGGSGWGWLKRQGAQLSGSLAKSFTPESAAALELGEDDVALLVIGLDHVTSGVLDRVRRDVIRKLGMKPAREHAFVWIEQFPMFEKDPKSGAAGAAAPSVHGAASGRRRSARERSRPRALDALRSRLQRQRAGEREHPHR